jgi:hypothetical protein
MMKRASAGYLIPLLDAYVGRAGRGGVGDGEPSTMTISGKDDIMNKDEETLGSHDHKATIHTRVAPPPPRVRLSDLRVAEAASSGIGRLHVRCRAEDGRCGRERLTEAMARWSVAEPATVGSFTGEYGGVSTPTCVHVVH